MPAYKRAIICIERWSSDRRPRRLAARVNVNAVSARSDTLVKSVKATGSIGVVGVFVPKDPGAQDELAKKGQLAFNFGEFGFKGQQIRTGQANVKANNRQLCNLINEGRANPSFIISHELPLSEAPNAYKHFDARDKGWNKVILKPGI